MGKRQRRNPTTTTFVGQEAGPVCCGQISAALVLSGERASGVKLNRILLQRIHHRRDVPGVPTDGVPIWSFKGSLHR